MRRRVLRSFWFGDGTQIFPRKPKFSFSFLFDAEHKNSKTEFEVYFLAPNVPDKLYKYGFTKTSAAARVQYENERRQTLRVGNA